MIEKYNEDLIVVTHGLYIRCIFKEILGMDIVKTHDNGFALMELNMGILKLTCMDRIDIE